MTLVAVSKVHALSAGLDALLVDYITYYRDYPCYLYLSWLFVGALEIGHLGPDQLPNADLSIQRHLWRSHRVSNANSLTVANRRICADVSE